MEESKAVKIIKRFIGDRDLGEMTAGQFALCVLKEAIPEMSLLEMAEAYKILKTNKAIVNRSLRVLCKEAIYLHHKCWLS